MGQSHLTRVHRRLDWLLNVGARTAPDDGKCLRRQQRKASGLAPAGSPRSGPFPGRIAVTATLTQLETQTQVHTPPSPLTACPLHLHDIVLTSEHFSWPSLLPPWSRPPRPPTPPCHGSFELVGFHPRHPRAYPQSNSQRERFNSKSDPVLPLLQALSWFPHCSKSSHILCRRPPVSRNLADLSPLLLWLTLLQPHGGLAG